MYSFHGLVMYSMVSALPFGSHIFYCIYKVFSGQYIAKHAKPFSYGEILAKHQKIFMYLIGYVLFTVVDISEVALLTG